MIWKKSDNSKLESIPAGILWIFLCTAIGILIIMIIVSLFTPFKPFNAEGNDFSSWMTMVVSSGVGVAIAFAFYKYSIYIKTKTETIIEERDQERGRRKKYAVETIRGYLTELKEYLVRVEESVAEFNRMPEPKKGAEHAPEWTDFTKSSPELVMFSLDSAKLELIHGLRTILHISSDTIEISLIPKINEVIEYAEKHKVSYAKDQMKVTDSNVLKSKIDHVLESLPKSDS